MIIEQTILLHHEVKCVVENNHIVDNLTLSQTAIITVPNNAISGRFTRGYAIKPYIYKHFTRNTRTNILTYTDYVSPYFPPEKLPYTKYYPSTFAFLLLRKWLIDIAEIMGWDAPPWSDLLTNGLEFSTSGLANQSWNTVEYFKEVMLYIMENFPSWEIYWRHFVNLNDPPIIIFPTSEPHGTYNTSPDYYYPRNYSFNYQLGYTESYEDFMGSKCHYPQFSFFTLFPDEMKTYNNILILHSYKTETVSFISGNDFWNGVPGSTGSSFKLDIWRQFFYDNKTYFFVMAQDINDPYMDLLVQVSQPNPLGPNYASLTGSYYIRDIAHMSETDLENAINYCFGQASSSCTCTVKYKGPSVVGTFDLMIYEIDYSNTDVTLKPSPYTMTFTFVGTPGGFFIDSAIGWPYTSLTPTYNFAPDSGPITYVSGYNGGWFQNGKRVTFITGSRYQYQCLLFQSYRCKNNTYQELYDAMTDKNYVERTDDKITKKTYYSGLMNTNSVRFTESFNNNSVFGVGCASNLNLITGSLFVNYPLITNLRFSVYGGVNWQLSKYTSCFAIPLFGESLKTYYGITSGDQLVFALSNILGLVTQTPTTKCTIRLFYGFYSGDLPYDSTLNDQYGNNGSYFETFAQTAKTQLGSFTYDGVAQYYFQNLPRLYVDTSEKLYTTKGSYLIFKLEPDILTNGEVQIQETDQVYEPVTDFFPKYNVQPYLPDYAWLFSKQFLDGNAGKAHGNTNNVLPFNFTLGDVFSLKLPQVPVK